VQNAFAITIADPGFDQKAIFKFIPFDGLAYEAGILWQWLNEHRL